MLPCIRIFILCLFHRVDGKSGKNSTNSTNNENTEGDENENGTKINNISSSSSSSSSSSIDNIDYNTDDSDSSTYIRNMKRFRSMLERDLNTYIVNMNKPQEETLYELRYVCVYIVTLFFVLLTYGVGYPPLALMITIAIVLQTIVLQVSIHLHFLQVRNNTKLFRKWSKLVQFDMQDVYLVLFDYKPTYLLCIVSAIFLSSFLIDMVFVTNRMLSRLLPLALVLYVCILLSLNYLFFLPEVFSSGYDSRSISISIDTDCDTGGIKLNQIEMKNTLNTTNPILQDIMLVNKTNCILT